MRTFLVLQVKATSDIDSFHSVDIKTPTVQSFDLQISGVVWQLRTTKNNYKWLTKWDLIKVNQREAVWGESIAQHSQLLHHLFTTLR